ncbi:MAG: nucleotidyltransferase family protein [Verrucomicrobia bacterium]|nr:nucleotidyltransferase family protein [Verrucomicrobiota bacterium]
MQVGVVLLAAGESRRMGKPKLLLPWGEFSILAHQLLLWQQLSTQQIAIVAASDDGALLAELSRLGFPPSHRILNPQPESGMFSSIRCAAQWPGWDKALTHWVITLGDQPQLKRETLQALLHFGAAHPDKVCQPRWRGRLHHPVLMPQRFFQPLAVTRSGMLSEFLQSIPGDVLGCDIEDPGLGFDIDTPEDYERAVSIFVQPGASGHEACAGCSIQGQGKTGG